MDSSGSNSVDFSGDNGIDSSTKVGAGGDLRKGLVCLSTQPAGTAIGLAFFGVYTVAPISFVAGRHHLTPPSSVSWAVKPPHYF